MHPLKDMHAHPVLLIPEQVLLPDGMHKGQALLIEDGRISAVGPAQQFQALDVRRESLPGRLLMPGFIDAHHHLTQSFGKSLVFGEPSEIFKRVWVPMEQFMDDDAIDTATRLAAWESLRGGFTTVADAGTRASVDVGIIAQATSDVGLRCVLGAICNDLRGNERVATREQILERAEHHLGRWDGHDLVHPSLAISIPEAATDEVLAAVARLAREASVSFQTHLNEHLAAVERSLVATGLRPLQRLARLGALGPELLAAHATLLTPDEILLLRDGGGAVSYNPVASTWKGNAVAQALLMSELGVRIGLGTDGTRSDAFRLLDAAETAQRLAHTMATGDSSSGGGWLWLDQGLRGGADAIGLRGKAGEITAGAFADLLVVNLDIPEFVPSWDPEWELVRLGNRDQIESVIVHGRLRLNHGRPVGWDGDALLQKARETAERIVACAPVQRIDPDAGEHRRLWKARHA
ncbi:MAG TPA: amidohydrolase family protein [Castellaniella sp.]|jgi:cytosine/adenosine deaminase-related metal-dependent hydrolase|nr:amidohydrolase family protein [Castellaniella sp.]